VSGSTEPFDSEPFGELRPSALRLRLEEVVNLLNPLRIELLSRGPQPNSLSKDLP